MKLNQVNIGAEIEARINQLGLSKSEFGRKIGIPQQNVNRILEKPSIDTDKLAQICAVLDFNFFTLFTPPTKISIDGNHNQLNEKGAFGNINAGYEPLLQEQIKHLEDKLKDRDERLREKDERISEKNEQIADLKERIQELKQR